MKIQVMLAMILAMGVVQAEEALWITGDTPVEEIIQAFQATVGAQKIREIQPAKDTRLMTYKPQATSQTPQTPQTEAPPILLKIQFAYNSTEIEQAYRKPLDNIARALVDPSLSGATWYVAGHTDSKGSEAYNMKLSRRRASAVRDYLIAQRVAPQQLIPKAYGESRPYDSQNPKAAINRRVEFMPLATQ